MIPTRRIIFLFFVLKIKREGIGLFLCFFFFFKSGGLEWESITRVKLSGVDIQICKKIVVFNLVGRIIQALLAMLAILMKGANWTSGTDQKWRFCSSEAIKRATKSNRACKNFFAELALFEILMSTCHKALELADLPTDSRSKFPSSTRDLSWNLNRLSLNTSPARVSEIVFIISRNKRHYLSVLRLPYNCTVLLHSVAITHRFNAHHNLRNYCPVLIYFSKK